MQVQCYNSYSSTTAERIGGGEPGTICTRRMETDDCSISFIESSSGKYVVKQIKDPSPDEQFLLVVDALSCHIAASAHIPMNRVTLLAPNSGVQGQWKAAFPATLHEMVAGVSVDHACRYQDINVHQRFRRENSPRWDRWGPLAPEESGLTLTVIQNMARHRDLPGIVALDTFVGNADRSAPNLFYDAACDRFCGIDMAASFCAPLAQEACKQLRALENVAWTQEERRALAEYAHTLEGLIKNWPPERQEVALLDYAQAGGFVQGSTLCDIDVIHRMEFHKRCMRENYEQSLELIKMLTPFT